MIILGCVFSTLVRAENTAIQRLHAHGVEVTLRVGPIQTTTAGRIVADLDVTGPTEMTIEIVPPAPQAPGQLTIVSATPRGPVVLRPGRMGYGLNVVFTPFLGGVYEVPAFAVAYRGAGAAGRLETTPVPLTITSVVAGDPATAVPDGILPDEAAPERPSWLHSRWIDVVALAIALVGWWLFRRQQRGGESAASMAGPYATALVAIEGLAVVDAAGLERAIETLRAHHAAPLPDGLLQPYQWIRFGSPGEAELARFADELKAHWRTEARRETGREVA